MKRLSQVGLGATVAALSSLRLPGKPTAPGVAGDIMAAEVQAGGIQSRRRPTLAKDQTPRCIIVRWRSRALP